MIQIFFKDDEMVASDGAYLRAIRHRKWIYLLGIILIILSNNFYHEKNFLNVVKLFVLPGDFLASSVFIGLIYLLIIYTLIIVQLFSSYKVILKSRFAFRKNDDLSAIEVKIKNIEADQKNLLKEYKTQRGDFSNRVKDLEEKSFKINSQIKKKIQDLSDELIINSGDEKNNKSNLNGYIKYSRDLTEASESLKLNMREMDYKFNESSKSYNAQHSELMKQKQEILKEDFYRNKKYRYSEIAIDIFKLSVAPLLAVYSIYTYLN